MQLILKIEDESVARKILWLLEHFKKDGLEIEQQVDFEGKTEAERLNNNMSEDWRRVVSEGLKDMDDKYYKSIRYKLDRAEYLMEKEKK